MRPNPLLGFSSLETLQEQDMWASGVHPFLFPPFFIAKLPEGFH